MRDPILHIKKSDLLQALNFVSIDLVLDISPVPVVTNEQLVDRIFEIASIMKFQLKDRYVVMANQKTGRRIAKTIEAENDVTEVFNRVVFSLVQQKQGRNVPKIDKKSKAYIPLKETAVLAQQFAADFQIESQSEAFKDFVTVAMEIMGRKFRVEKIRFYIPQIYEMTECLIAIEKDSNPQGSRLFYEHWRTAGLKYSTAFNDIVKEADFVHIIYGRQEADAASADYIDWITAQFDQLAFLSAIPEMSQLYGTNAQKRYQRYMSNRGIKRQPAAGNTLADKKEYGSSVEEEYFKKLREKRAT